MSNYNWEEIAERLRYLFTEDVSDFNEEATYCIMRKFNPGLPFNFENYIRIYKEERNISFIERRKILGDIFMNLDVEKRLDLINYVLYYFRKKKLNRRKVSDLEKYLDENR